MDVGIGSWELCPSATQRRAPGRRSGRSTSITAAGPAGPLIQAAKGSPFDSDPSIAIEQLSGACRPSVCDGRADRSRTSPGPAREDRCRGSREQPQRLPAAASQCWLGRRSPRKGSGKLATSPAAKTSGMPVRPRGRSRSSVGPGRFRPATRWPVSCRRQPERSVLEGSPRRSGAARLRRRIRAPPRRSAKPDIDVIGPVEIGDPAAEQWGKSTFKRGRGRLEQGHLQPQLAGGRSHLHPNQAGADHRQAPPRSRIARCSESASARVRSSWSRPPARGPGASAAGRPSLSGACGSADVRPPSSSLEHHRVRCRDQGPRP